MTATSQYARVNNGPMLSHERAVKQIIGYSLDTGDKGIIFKPDLAKGLACYVDAVCVGGWKDANYMGEQNTNQNCTVYS